MRKLGSGFNSVKPLQEAIRRDIILLYPDQYVIQLLKFLIK